MKQNRKEILETIFKLFLTRHYEDVSYDDMISLEQVKKSRLPMLFIHGDADDYVPTRMVYPLYGAKPGDKELWVVPGASHANSYRDNREEYTRRVGEFVGRYIGGRPE